MSAAIVALTAQFAGPVAAFNPDQKWKLCPLASYDNMINWGWNATNPFYAATDAVNRGANQWSAVGREFISNGPTNLGSLPSSYCKLLHQAVTPNWPMDKVWAYETNIKWLGFGEIQSASLTFNNPPPFGVSWYLGTGTPSSSQVDLWSIAAHEWGHAVALNHSSSSGNVMYSGLNGGQTRRYLSVDDRAGISYWYPAH